MEKSRKQQLSFRRKLYYLRLDLRELLIYYAKIFKVILKNLWKFLTLPFYLFQKFMSFINKLIDYINSALNFIHKALKIPVVTLKIMTQVFQLAALLGIADYLVINRKKFLFLKKLIAIK